MVFKLSSNSYQVGEGDSSVTITIQRQIPPGTVSGSTNVTLSTSDGTAVSGADYVSKTSLFKHQNEHCVERQILHSKFLVDLKFSSQLPKMKII